MSIYYISYHPFFLYFFRLYKQCEIEKKCFTLLPKVLLILLRFVFFAIRVHAYCYLSFVIRELSQRDARPIPLSNLHCTHCSTFSNINKTIYTYYSRLHLEAFAPANNKTLKDILYYARAFPRIRFTHGFFRGSRFRSTRLITLLFQICAYISCTTYTAGKLLRRLTDASIIGRSRIFFFQDVIIIIMIIKILSRFCAYRRRDVSCALFATSGTDRDETPGKLATKDQNGRGRYGTYKYCLRRHWTLYCVTRVYLYMNMRVDTNTLYPQKRRVKRPGN